MAPNEGDRFWNDMERTPDSVGNGYRLCILGDLNGFKGDRTRAGITGTFGVPGENDNSRRVVEFRAERGLCVGNTSFKHTRVVRGQGGVDIKSMRNLVLVE